MDRPWFDQETGTLLLDEYVLEMDSYRRLVEDEVITDAELVEQTQRVALKVPISSASFFIVVSQKRLAGA